MDANKRKYIRHPVDIPIEVNVGNSNGRQQVRDVDEGGLCFACNHAVNTGDEIHIVISVCQPTFDAMGVVCWCRFDGDTYLVGIAFQDEAVAYGIRMVEQVCHIEDYKQQVFNKTGEKISSDQAAKEWISKYAGDFPSLWS